MSVITKPQSETTGTVAAARIPAPTSSPERAPQARPDGGSGGPSRSARKGRAKAVVGVVALAGGVGVGIGFAAASDGHARPISSSDVAACSLLSGSAVSGILHTPLSAPPAPGSTDRALAGYDYTRQATAGVFAANEHQPVIDACRYQPRSAPGQYVATYVLPAGEVYLNEALGSATVVPLGGVGQQAAIGESQTGSLTKHVVYARVGRWFVELDTVGADRQTAITLAKALADAPQLQFPPAGVR